MTNTELFDSWRDYSDAQLATALASHVGQLLDEHRTLLIERGTSVWQLKDSGDLLAHHFLMEAFAA
ncbi:MAG: hypothetical protein RIR69_483, partial [Actinomycetota bacterium]